MLDLQATTEEEKKSIELIQKIAIHRFRIRCLEFLVSEKIKENDLEALVTLNEAIKEEETEFELTKRELQTLHQVWFKRIAKVVGTDGC